MRRLRLKSCKSSWMCVLLQVYIEKQKGEILGVVIVESGWGSILPTVIIASMMHAGPAEKSGRLNIGDQIMTINGTSLVGLPLSTCQSIIKVHCSQSMLDLCGYSLLFFNNVHLKSFPEFFIQSMKLSPVLPDVLHVSLWTT